MTDKELLEYAAKAAGYEYKIDHPRGAKHPTGVRINTGGSCWPIWNPLDDDGDALRLAVKMGFSVTTHRIKPVVRAGNDVAVVEEVLSDDPYAATRRAIVRAAAEIGKDMK